MKTALFDLDDTLFDHLYAASSGLKSIREHLPRFADRPFSELEAEYSVLLESVHRRVLSGELDLDRARLIRISELMSDGDATPDETGAQEVSHLFRESYLRNRRTVEGAEELLSELRSRDITIAIVTNNQTAEQIEKLAFTGLDTLTDFMVTSEETGSPKPDPRMFHVALERAGCTPDEAVVVGDSWESDVTGAMNAGIRAVWFNPGGLPAPEPLGVAEIRSLLPSDGALRSILAPGQP